MLDLTVTHDRSFGPITRVVEAALNSADELSPNDILLVGAWCRDVLHHAQGHTFATTATRDLDLALSLSSWDAFSSLAAAFPRVGDTGIRFRIANIDVDLLPFGSVEDPPGIVAPPSRGESLSVWAFEEVFADSLPLSLSPTVTIRIPTVAGFAAAKLGAWLDRSEWQEAKDAPDLALIMHWYAESAAIHDRLYDTPAGNETLIAEGTDITLAAAHLLGKDISETIGATRRAELLKRWPNDAGLLIRELQLHGGPAWPHDPQRRRSLLDALTRGLTAMAA